MARCGDRSCRVKILSAGAGVGKTVIMSKLSENESVAAMHFCRHDDERKRIRGTCCARWRSSWRSVCQRTVRTGGKS